MCEIGERLLIDVVRSCYNTGSYWKFGSRIGFNKIIGEYF